MFVSESQIFQAKQTNLFIELIIGNTGYSERSVCIHSFRYFMFKAFYIILKILYFHIQTSSIKRKDLTLIVRIFLFQRAHIQYRDIFRHFSFTSEMF